MKIIDKSRDYYDHLSKIYGEDEKIIYNRKMIKIDSLYYSEPIKAINRENLIDHFPLFEFYTLTKGNKFRTTCYGKYYLVVCGRMYPIIVKNLRTGELEFEHKFDYEDDRHEYLIYDESIHGKEIKIIKYLFSERNDNIMIGVQTPFFENLCKIVNQPVFLMSLVNRDRILCYNTCKLADIGLSKYYPAEQLYQDISYYISNILNQSPDMMPEIKRDDIEKLESHGFDKKKSFRHRK